MFGNPIIDARAKKNALEIFKNLVFEHKNFLRLVRLFDLQGDPFFAEVVVCRIYGAE